LVPKLFGPIRERYLSRPGGYTRVLRIEPVKEDQAESAILELIDGPKDMRFAMTAKTLSHLPQDRLPNEMTAKNVKKVTQFRENGMATLRQMVGKMTEYKEAKWDDRILAAPRRVYLYEERFKRDRHYPQQVGDWKLPNKIQDGATVLARRGMRITRASAKLRRHKKKADKREVETLAETEGQLANLSLAA
jgi:large subunit ribosomal protein L17